MLAARKEYMAADNTILNDADLRSDRTTINVTPVAEVLRMIAVDAMDTANAPTRPVFDPDTARAIAARARIVFVDGGVNILVINGAKIGRAHV